MGSSYLTNPIQFLIQTLFGLYILAIMLRFLLQWVRADFYNPISQFLVKITNPPLRPLRRVIPGLGGIDLAAVLLMLALQVVAILLIQAVAGVLPSLGFTIVASIAELVDLGFNVFLFAIFIQVIISWINPGAHNPATGLLYSLTEPVLRPARRMIPAMGGLDLSPMAVIIAIYLLKMLLIPPIEHIARSLL